MYVLFYLFHRPTIVSSSFNQRSSVTQFFTKVVVELYIPTDDGATDPDFVESASKVGGGDAKGQEEGIL